jgi:putative transposase
MARGFLYLVAMIDWFSRAVLAWRLSNTMDATFCVEALEAAPARFGEPEIVNSDQGAQFTSAAFTTRLEAVSIAISMDGRGRRLDNVFVERLWRSLKYEEVHLKAHADGRATQAGIDAWIALDNDRRPHQALAYRTPMAVWRGGRETAVDMPPGTLAGGWATLARRPHAHSRNRNSNRCWFDRSGKRCRLPPWETCPVVSGTRTTAVEPHHIARPWRENVRAVAGAWSRPKACTAGSPCGASPCTWRRSTSPSRSLVRAL